MLNDAGRMVIVIKTPQGTEHTTWAIAGPDSPTFPNTQLSNLMRKDNLDSTAEKKDSLLVQLLDWNSEALGSIFSSDRLTI